MQKRPVRAALLAALLATSTPAAARDIEGVRFADAYEAGDVHLRLDCVGLLRYRAIFKGYVAGLYLPADTRPADVLSDVPKRLELSYFWDIRGNDFASAGDEILARNLDDSAVASLRPRLAQLNALYEDVKPGDRYALTYVPGVGTQLALNGETKGTIEGADFAAAYFSIWLGKSPIDQALKDQLTNCS